MGRDVAQPRPSLCFDKSSVTQFFQSLLNLFDGVHHEGTIRYDRFLERRACDEHEAHGIIFCLDRDVVAICEFDQVYG